MKSKAKQKRVTVVPFSTSAKILSPKRRINGKGYVQTPGITENLNCAEKRFELEVKQFGVDEMICASERSKSHR